VFSFFTAHDKVALVFGISTYRSHGPPLPAVEHDIQHTVHALEKMKFRVISLLDLTLQEMKDAIDHFCDLVAAGVYGSWNSLSYHTPLSCKLLRVVILNIQIVSL